MYYCERWHRHYKEMILPLTAEEARRRDKDKDLYTVVVGEADAPYCFIEINLGMYGVSFLDEHKREYMAYTFDEIEEDRLFLKEAVYRDYQGNSNEVVRATAYRFSPDGRVSVEKTEAPFRQAGVTEGQADVSGNWEPKPHFGDYAALIRKDR